MKGKLYVAALALAVALAGCAQQDDGTDDGDGTPPPGGDGDGGTGDAYTLTTTGVPATAQPATAFTFTLRIDGPEATSDHIGAHYGLNTSATPTTSLYNMPCEHQPGDLPGTFTVRCTIATPGTYHLRGHMRINATDPTREWWGPDTTITVGPVPSTGTVRVGTDVPFEPFETFNTTSNDYEGFDIDLMREIGRRAGLTVAFETRTFATLIPAIESGDIDAAISSMSITDEREEQVDFSIPYYEANQSVLVRTADKDAWDTLEEMHAAGKKVGVQSGTVGDEKATEVWGQQAVQRYDTYDVALAALKGGTIDGIVMDLPQQKNAAEQDASVAIAFEFDVGDVYGIAVKKGNAALLAQINAALTSMIADGSYDELRDKWNV